uniref:Uncharacterized protein n=1 Tax=Amphimedon queenslandica TaxID=400682 RepID=A0A1X7T292_AMPQE
VSQLDFGDQGACEESLVHDAGVVEGRLEEHVYGAVDSGLDPVPSAVREEVMELKRIWHEVMSLCELLEDNRAIRGKKPWWHRRLEKDIKVLRSNISVMESKRAGRLKKMSKYKLLEKKYNIKRKGFQVVLEELKQRLVAKSGKVRRYEQRIKQYTQNCLFNSNQKRFYQQLDGGIE